MLTILGLGPGDPNLLTREAWVVLSRARVLHLRTRKHPTVAGLPRRIRLRSYDHLYRKHENFDDVYAAIVRAVMRAARNADVVYAVPGHPLIGERTTPLLLARARELGIPTRQFDGARIEGFREILEVLVGEKYRQFHVRVFVCNLHSASR